MKVQKLLVSLLVLLIVIPEASAGRMYKYGRADPYKYQYYNSPRQLKPGPKGSKSGRTKISKTIKEGEKEKVFWWPDASYKYV